MAIEWYYTGDGERRGPVTSAELKQLAASGVITPDDLVWREGMKKWTPARKVQGLHSATLPPPIEEPQPEIQVQILRPRHGLLARIAKWISIGWSGICLLGILSGLANVGSTLESASSEYEEAGAAVGVGCGMGVWLVFWAAIAIPSLVVWVLAKEKD